MITSTRLAHCQNVQSEFESNSVSVDNSNCVIKLSNGKSLMSINWVGIEIFDTLGNLSFKGLQTIE